MSLLPFEQKKLMHLSFFSMVSADCFRRNERVLMLVLLVIIVVFDSLYSLHGVFVNVFEEEYSKQGASVGENEEDPDMLSLFDFSAEENRKGQAEGGGWVEWRAGHNAVSFGKAHNSNVGSGNDQGGDCGVR